MFSACEKREIYTSQPIQAWGVQKAQYKLHGNSNSEPKAIQLQGWEALTSIQQLRCDQTKENGAQNPEKGGIVAKEERNTGPKRRIKSWKWVE